MRFFFNAGISRLQVENSGLDLEISGSEVEFPRGEAERSGLKQKRFWFIIEFSGSEVESSGWQGERSGWQGERRGSISAPWGGRSDR